MGGKISKNNSSSNDTATTSSSSNNSISGKAFNGLGNLIRLLPTGTVFVFQFLNPVVTNDGRCGAVLNKYLAGALLIICAFNCVFASFTDSYTGSDGARHYGIVTTKGIWPSPASVDVDLKAYRLRFGDFVHALLSLLVFAVLGLLDNNTVQCFYPKFETQQKVLLQVLPPAIGALSGVVFMMFPNNRHGIGYPASSDDNAARSSQQP
ncbi:protein DMP2-like [Prosopis cineraria]|uniref:protein DMP2-like n=1 Tax=Prosopis cineraria TaxID=364024 RepID=UPI00240F95AC|nr:protein DMP2-like [Prosopis cineraria]